MFELAIDAAARGARAALIATLLLGVAAPNASEAARLVVAVEELVDGQPAPSSETEVALMEALRADDRWVFVDAAQSTKVRKAAGSRSLLDTDAADLVTSLTADVLVVGRFELTKADPGPFKSVVVYEGTAQIKMIAVDSAEVVNAFRVSVMQRHFRPRAARSKAAGDLAAAVAKKLTPPGTPRFQLDVALEPGATPEDAEEIVRCIRRATGAEKVAIQHFDSQALLIEMRSKQAPPQVAKAIAAANRSDACGLSIVSYSSRQVRLRHSPSLALQLAPTPLKPLGKVAPRDRWMGSELSRSVAMELAQLPYLNLEAGGELPAGLATKQRKAGRLLLSGTYRLRGGKLSVGVEIYATYRRRLLLKASSDCAEEDLDACVQALASGLRGRLMSALRARRADVPLQKTLPKPPPDLLKVVKLELDGIYPSRLGYYHRVTKDAGRPVNPVGYVHLENRTDKKLEGLTLQARLSGLSERGLTVEPIDLAPGAKHAMPIFLRFDQEKLAAHDDNRSEVLELDFTFELDDLTYPLRHDAGVMVYERNAVNWAKEKASVAAFVSPRAPAVVSLVDAVQSKLPSEQTHRLAVPIAIFEALSGLEYRRDPDNPYRPDELDSVQYPSETLARGGGDCDDLAVAYASALQAAGWATMLVQTPGHVFVAVGTQVPPSNAIELSVDPDAVIQDHHTLWVPVETTQIGKPFSDAWATAAKELRAARRAKKDPTLIRVRDAWERFPPVDLSVTPARRTPPPSLDRLPKAVSRTVKRLEAQRARTVKRLSTSKDPVDINRYGVLLAQSGKRDEAAQAFEKSRSLAERSPVLNNLGNLELLAAHAQAAYELYERSIAADAENLPVRVNALLALHTLAQGETRTDDYERAFVDHLLDLHARAPQMVVALQARLPQVGKTGSAEGITSVEGLSDRIDTVLASRGKKTRPAPLITRSRPGDTGLERHVNWLY